MQRTVSSTLVLDVPQEATVMLQIACAQRPGLDIDDTLDLGGGTALGQLDDGLGGRRDHVGFPAGTHEIRYQATVSGEAEPFGDDPGAQFVAGLPSRYVESDSLPGPAAELFGGLTGIELLQAVRAWVHDSLSYVLGSSRVTDGAVQTFLAREGVCRDYAHLTIALLRACRVPARLVACYAPGLDPMDFHAVAEAWVDGQWCVVDSTGLAPRTALLRISTGRDAADTSFMTTLEGAVTLTGVEVSAVVDGQLPADDQTAPTVLA